MYWSPPWPVSQLALNVSDLDEAIAFYSSLFGTTPAKVQPGYANFAIADPPLKLVLMEQDDARGTGVAGALNHLGVEVASTDEVAAAGARLVRRGSRHRHRGGRPAATPSRTRCGSRTRTVRPGRSTPCWPTRRRRGRMAPAAHRGARGDRADGVLLTQRAMAQIHDRRGALAPPHGRVPGQRLPGRAGDRLRHRRPDAVAGRHRTPALRERRGDGSWSLHHHLDVRPRLGRALQPRGLLRRRHLRGHPWRDAAAYLPAQVAGLRLRRRGGQRDVLRAACRASRPSTGPRRHTSSRRSSPRSVCCW